MAAMTDARPREFDVVIVGGGLVGGALACLLQPLGLRVAVLERRAFDPAAVSFNRGARASGLGGSGLSGLGDSSSGSGSAGAGHPCFDPRVSALSRASQELLRGLRAREGGGKGGGERGGKGKGGVWGEVLARRCCPYTGMDVWDADGSGAVSFTAAEVGQPELGHIVENSLILEVLNSRLAAAAGVELLSPCTVTGLHGPGAEAESATETTLRDGMVRLETEEGMRLAASLVVGADGGHSAVRRLAGFATRQWDYGHEALVTTVQCEHPHGHIARQIFMDSGPLAFLPLTTAPQSATAESESQPAAEPPPPMTTQQQPTAAPPPQEAAEQGQHYCSIVWSMPPAMAGEVMALADADFRHRLAAAFEHRLGAIHWADRRFRFPLRQCHAVDYARPGIVLVGDAAHTIHPLAGQGVNLGLLDVKVLTEELQRGLAAGRRPGDPVILRRYQRRRRPHNLATMWLMEALKSLFAPHPPPLRWLRNTGLSGLNHLPPLKRHIARYAMGLSPDLGPSIGIRN